MNWGLILIGLGVACLIAAAVLWFINKPKELYYDACGETMTHYDSGIRNANDDKGISNMIPSNPVTTPNYQDCQKQCSDNPDCKGWQVNPYHNGCHLWKNLGHHPQYSCTHISNYRQNAWPGLWPGNIKKDNPSFSLITP